MVQELANLSELELIEKDGSPSSKKLFVLWNPSAPPTTVWFRNLDLFEPTLRLFIYSLFLLSVVLQKSEESSNDKNSKGDAADNSSR